MDEYEHVQLTSKDFWELDVIIGNGTDRINFPEMTHGI